MCPISAPSPVLLYTGTGTVHKRACCSQLVFIQYGNGEIGSMPQCFVSDDIEIRIFFAYGSMFGMQLAKLHESSHTVAKTEPLTTSVRKPLFPIRAFEISPTRGATFFFI